jgi:predicted metal-binding membrane protein
MRRMILLLTVALVMAGMMLAMAAPVFAEVHTIDSNACRTGQANENSPVVVQGFRSCTVTAPPEQAAIP